MINLEKIVVENKYFLFKKSCIIDNFKYIC